MDKSILSELPKVIYVSIRRVDLVSIMAYVVMGRGSLLPVGAAWFDQGLGIWSRRATDDLISEEVRKACVADGMGPALSWRVVKAEDVPSDRTYRAALVDNGLTIEHSLPKAKEVHRNLLRKLRVPALKELDAQWMRDFGQGKSFNDIEVQRQRWRDAPADPRIDMARSVDELKAHLKEFQ